jgi:hypothetical protein
MSYSNKFVYQHFLFLKGATEDTLEPVVDWAEKNGIGIQGAHEALAPFTKTGKGKPVPCIVLFLHAPTQIIEQLQTRYPAPQSMELAILSSEEDKRILETYEEYALEAGVNQEEILSLFHWLSFQ